MGRGHDPDVTEQVVSDANRAGDGFQCPHLSLMPGTRLGRAAGFTPWMIFSNESDEPSGPSGV
jgi:hypothetical protein